MLAEARPATLEASTLTVRFPAGSEFYLKQAESNRDALHDVLRGLTGAGLRAEFELGVEDDGSGGAGQPPLTEADLVARLRSEFGARELGETATPEVAPDPDEAGA